MCTITENVREVLTQLVPASIINDIACFVFYDNHPKDEKNIDVTLCTKMGDVREYYQRELLSSITLDSVDVQTEIKIFRNSLSKLFYLVYGGNELTFLTRKEDKLQVHNKLTDVINYEICDPECEGSASVKIYLEDSDEPVVADDTLENFKCTESETLGCQMNQEQEELITHLKRKYTEAAYCLKCNEDSYQDFLKLRQTVAFSMYKEISPSLADTEFKDDYENVARTLKIHAQKPWIKMCNKKIVIVYFVCNGNAEGLEDVYVLLHGIPRSSIDYTTKIFEKIDSPPYWYDTNLQILRPNIESALVVVVDLKEIKKSVVSKIVFNGAISYTKQEKECILPIEDVTLTAMETMGEEFDVLCSDPMDGNIMLAVMASTVKTDLILRHLKAVPTEQYNLSFDIFSQHLNMEKVLNEENIVMYRKSPYHVLNGLMIMPNSEEQVTSNKLAVTVYSRSSSQVLALIHYIHETVPYQIVTTTPTYKMTATSGILSIRDVSLQGGTNTAYNYRNYTTSMLTRTSLALEFLNNCMIRMSMDAAVWNRVGSEIDLFAQSEDKYNEFKEKMRAEAARGADMLFEVIPEHMSE